MTPPAHLYRSVLYVPADKPRALEKARTLPADAVIIDLEDAVAPAHKAAAREAVRQALESPWPRPPLLRLNAAFSPWFEDDLALAVSVWPKLSGAVLPKVDGAADIKTYRSAFQMSLDDGDTFGLGQPPLWPMLETPLGVLHAAEIAAYPEVAGLIAGTNDLAAALRVSPEPTRGALLHALSSIVLAARAYGKVPLDGVYNAVHSEEAAGLAQECEQGRALGFAGKTLIHPAQIAPANAAYSVSDAAAARSRELLAAWEAGQAAGQSVITFEGKLVEALHIAAAQEELALWEAAQES